MGKLIEALVLEVSDDCVLLSQVLRGTFRAVDVVLEEDLCAGGYIVEAFCACVDG